MVDSEKQTLNTPIHCTLFKRSFAALRMTGDIDNFGSVQKVYQF